MHESLDERVLKLEKQVETLLAEVAMLSGTSYKTAKREIINREIQFLQKCYNKSGGLIPEINA